MADDQIRIEGRLADDAFLGFTAGKEPQAVLVLEVRPAKGLPYRIRQHLGSDPNAHLAAEAKKNLLRRGSKVAVYGAGLRAQSDHGTAALFVLDVTDVIPDLSPTAAHTEANPSEEA